MDLELDYGRRSVNKNVVDDHLAMTEQQIGMRMSKRFGEMERPVRA